MALSQPYYNLKNLRVTLSGGQSGLVDLSIKRNPTYATKWPGQSPNPSQVFMGENFPDITATIYNDDNFTFSDVVPNAAIESFELLSPNDSDESFLGTLLTAFPPESMVFGGPETMFNGNEPSTVKVPIMSNVLNPGADGGFPD